MRRLSPNHAQKEGERITSLPNAALLDEALTAAMGDDYDGCSTRNHEITTEILYAELKSRLAAWLAEPAADGMFDEVKPLQVVSIPEDELAGG